MNSRFAVVIIGLLVIFGGFFVLTKNKSKAPASNTSTAPTNHVMGGGKKNVTHVEYGDFECPACGAYYPIVEQVKEKYKDDIHFQFRNFPLSQIHKHAFEGSRAAEAADKQGKFWEMYNLLYQNQKTWSAETDPTNSFVNYAKELGMDTTKFRADMLSQQVNDLINADIREGTKLGANATPTFVLEGKKISTNPRSLEEFNKLIDDAIAAKNKQ
jgi:protein-disulfide isomerase